ncbi:hypothetical protein BS50DRAFT_222079 [Corynespora cassiicola Philippines]|uniref:Uncharacterized protein n=1 Tax=Corynespora cassiicola Philippines TaxID=1448308 RepID=A0A2T2N3A4_CORCC|nr:hypothetical protein BS50DRAFT_222079 [Corynespora cassiicola Philippines]
MTVMSNQGQLTVARGSDSDPRQRSKTATKDEKSRRAEHPPLLTRKGVLGRKLTMITQCPPLPVPRNIRRQLPRPWRTKTTAFDNKPFTQRSCIRNCGTEGRVGIEFIFLTRVCGMSVRIRLFREAHSILLWRRSFVKDINCTAGVFWLGLELDEVATHEDYARA